MKLPVDLTWKCHICGELRPDDKVSVLRKPWYFMGQIVGYQNIRYCNDRPECYDGALKFEFIAAKGEEYPHE